jgi:hypothetical protein
MSVSAAAMAKRPVEHALAHVAAGRPVFPCREAGEKPKAPYLPGESAPGARDGGHWLASDDPDAVRAWWKRWPSAIIGLPTGLRSRTVVVDLDPKEAEPEAMLGALGAWCGGLEWADPATGEVLEPGLSRTRSGGFHVWFRYPTTAALATIAALASERGVAFDGRVENRGGLFRRLVRAGEASPLLSNIDVRAEGGYVIAPPSVMADGKSYAWIIKPESFAPLPPKLLALIARLIEPRARLTPTPNPSPQGGGGLRRGGGERAARYADVAIRAIAADLARAGKGQRGTAAFAAASSAGRYVVLGVVPAATVLAALEAACAANGLIATDGRASVRRELENGIRAASEHSHLAELATRLGSLEVGHGR